MKRRKDSKGRVLEKGESQRKDGRYVYQYEDVFGTRKSVYSKNLSELRKKEKQIHKDLAEGINASEITLDQLFGRYMAMKIKLTIQTKTNYIDLWENNVRGTALGNRRISDIKRSDIWHFYNSLKEKGLKYSTIKTFNGILVPCFDLAVADDLVRKNPCQNVIKEFYENDAAPKYSLTNKEQEIFLEFAQKNKIYAKHYPMLVVMLETAIRCGEAIGLTWDDVDFARNTITISHQLIYKKIDGKYRFFAGPPKTRAGVREIPMTRQVREALREQREYQLATGSRTDVSIDGYENFCFSTKRRNPIMPAGINNILYNIVSSYNTRERELAEKQKRNPYLLPHISAHILRHTGCTRMAEDGVDLKVLQYIMGHNDISVTMQVYNHVTAERNKKEMEKREKIRLLG